MRITPACAGTTSHDCRHNQAGKDHPRVCGNHLAWITSSPASPGSPPRVREPQSEVAWSCQCRRITPACAGTTNVDHLLTSLSLDHPRVCGNHSVDPSNMDQSAGSPPRVREPRGEHSIDLMTNRITPACAGTTDDGFAANVKFGDHPRVCGNHKTFG